ncbi:MAG: diguanylate cyclase [Spirochaetota bacterium]
MKVCLINHTKTTMKPIEDLAEELNLQIITASAENAVNIIKDEAPSVVLLNWTDSSTLDLSLSIRQIKLKNKYIYIIITGTKDITEEMFMAVSESADDYFFMPFSKNELMIKLHLAAKNIELNNQVTATKRKLVMHAKEDPVTGVLNRRALLDEILNEMGRAARKDEFSSTIMINLINHNEMLIEFGHRAIDSFMAEFSRILKKSVRPYDKLGRYDTNRFLIFLPNTNNTNAKIVAKRIIAGIESKKFRFRESVFQPCLSMGISELNPSDMGENKNSEALLINDLIMDSFIRRAEMASNKACEKGSNNIEIYTFT